MGPTWDPPGADRTQVGPMLAHEPCYQGGAEHAASYCMNQCWTRSNVPYYVIRQQSVNLIAHMVIIEDTWLPKNHEIWPNNFHRNSQIISCFSEEFDEDFSDRCIGELIGTSHQGAEKCGMSSECLTRMFTRGGFEYQLTHQLLYTIVAEQVRFSHNDIIKWKHFPCYWPFVRGCLTKVSDVELWCFLWSAPK